MKNKFSKESDMIDYDEVDITFLVLTYNSNLHKLFVTLNSIISQKNIRYQLVISDDGSELFDKTAIEEFLIKNKVTNYIVKTLNENVGTVGNIRNGLCFCKSEYVKLLSPGDYLYGVNIAREWLDCIKKNNASVCFGECIYYNYYNNELVPVSMYSSPQINDKFYKGRWEYNYLIFDDRCIGACVLLKTELLKEYIELIYGKIKYTEDNIYRIMAYKCEKACYLRKESLLYEYGTGISTSGSQKWEELIKKEFLIADEIMMNIPINDYFLENNFKRKVDQQSETNRIKRRFKYLFINGVIYNKIRCLKKKKTSTVIDMEYVHKIHCLNNIMKGDDAVCR